MHDLSADPAHAGLLAELRQALVAKAEAWNDRATREGATFWQGLGA